MALTVDIILVALGFLFILFGQLGSILPALPGPPLSYIGILLIHFSSLAQFTAAALIIWALVVILIQILDFVIPSIGTKKFGGSSYGTWGCNIGVVAGAFAGPLGIVFFPFLGAVIGEMIKGSEMATALKAGFGAFLGFLAGTIIKIALTVYFLIEAIIALAR